jgi:hypothetical protein
MDLIPDIAELSFSIKVLFFVVEFFIVAVSVYVVWKVSDVLLLLKIFFSLACIFAINCALILLLLGISIILFRLANPSV